MTTRIFLSKANNQSIPSFIPDSIIALDQQQSHYVHHVLRLERGHLLVVIDPESERSYKTQIHDLGTTTTVRVLSENDVLDIKSPVETLLYPLTKGDTIELVLEKACELGVRSIILWQSARSVVRIQGESSIEKKLSRWAKVLQAAAQQSEKSYLPSLRYYEDLATALHQLPPLQESGDIRITCSLEQDALPIKDALSTHSRAHIIVGPEGDFAPEEVALLSEHQFIKASLGPYRLRAETAAIAATAMAITTIGFAPNRVTR